MRQSGEASRLRVCYQRGLPRLVYKKTGFDCESSPHRFEITVSITENAGPKKTILCLL